MSSATLGHSRTTVGLTRSRGVTVVAGPPDPYGLIGMIQTIYSYYYTAHSTTWELDAAVYPFDDRPQDILDTIRPLEPVSWGSVPLALRITFPDATCHALRLTLRRRRLPRDEGPVLAPDGSPVYPKVTGSQARNTQRVLRLTLPTTGTAPLEQDGFIVELLPKLAFFTLWDRPPSTGLVRNPPCDDAAGGPAQWWSSPCCP